MKTIGKWTMGLLLAGVVLVSGCGMQDYLVKRVPVIARPGSTNQVDVVSTNQTPVVETKAETVVVKPAETKADGTFVPAVLDTRLSYMTNFIATLVTNRMEIVTPPVVYTNVTLNGSVVQGAERVASLTGVPWADTAVTGLSAIAAVVFGFFNNRNKKRALDLADGLAQKETALQTAQLVGKTVVENFETLRQAALKIPAYAEKDAEVMKVVQKIQDAAGVKMDIHQLVEDHTPYTKDQPATAAAQ